MAVHCFETAAPLERKNPALGTGFSSFNVSQAYSMI